MKMQRLKSYLGAYCICTLVTLEFLHECVFMQNSRDMFSLCSEAPDHFLMSFGPYPAFFWLTLCFLFTSKVFMNFLHFSLLSQCIGLCKVFFNRWWWFCILTWNDCYIYRKNYYFFTKLWHEKNNSRYNELVANFLETMNIWLVLWLEHLKRQI